MSVFIIAEAGVNHNNNLSLAKQLVEQAKEAGADAVKFQTYKTNDLVTLNAPKANYQKSQNSQEPDNSQYQMLKDLELSFQMHHEIVEHCKKCSIEFMSTAFDIESLQFLIQLGIKRIKIPSGEITNFPLLQSIARCGLPIILSTGMSDLIEISEALEVMLEVNPQSNISILHCTSSYPAPYNEVNLNALLTLKNYFKLPVGYSDHTIDNLVSPVAVGMGASIIEKHFTIDKSLPGPDHKMSLSPLELKQLVQAIRNVEQALGDGIKKPTTSELEVRDVARRSLVVNTDLNPGDILRNEHVSILRPGTGLAPKYINKFIGKKLRTQLKVGELLAFEHIEINECS